MFRSIGLTCVRDSIQFISYTPYHNHAITITITSTLCTGNGGLKTIRMKVRP